MHIGVHVSVSRRLAHATVGFAGSRRGIVPGAVSSRLVGALSAFGCRFAVGCAPGIDACCRSALAASAAPRTTVYCAFPSRVPAVQASGLRAVCISSKGLSAAAALHRRTVSMVGRCSTLVLFPDDPATGAWGRGSSLAFNTAVQRHIPVFVVTEQPPTGTRQYRVFADSLCGVINGYWVVPSYVGELEGLIDAR